MKNTSPNLDELQAEAIAFRDSFSSLLLATCDSQQTPHISYAPYISDSQHNYYIFVSELARHTQNLHNNPNASLLLIEDEQQARNIFARKRLSLEVSAQKISTHTSEHENILNLMTKELGNTLDILRNLPDFHLFKLSFKHGSYIRGFGQAYELIDAQFTLAAQQSR